MLRSRIPVWLRRAAFWIPWAACTWLAFTPALPGGPAMLSDKALHVLAFGYLMASLTAAHFPRAPLIVPAVLLLGYGAGIEAVQSLLPSRQAEAGDLGADLLGIAAACLLVGVVRRLAPTGT